MKSANHEALHHVMTYLSTNESNKDSEQFLVESHAWKVLLTYRVLQRTTVLTAVSSSQHAEQVQLVACGVRIPSSINVCRLRPPNLILLFQSLLDARPQSASNSLGVYHISANLMQRPRPPDPNRCLCNSALVFCN
jgi:hypothetical protein